MPPYSCTSVQYNQLDHESISEAKNLPKAMFVCLVKIKAWNEVFFWFNNGSQNSIFKKRL